MSTTARVLVCTRERLDEVCEQWFPPLEPPRAEVRFDHTTKTFVVNHTDVPTDVLPPDITMEQTLERVGRLTRFPRELTLSRRNVSAEWRESPTLYYLFDFADIESHDDYLEALATPFPVLWAKDAVGEQLLDRVNGGDEWGDSSERAEKGLEVFLFVTGY